MSLGKFGYDLYTGKRSFNFVARRKLWYAISVVFLLVAIFGPFLHGGYKFGIEFTGGSQFQITEVKNQNLGAAREAITSSVDREATVTALGKGILVRTDQLTDVQSNAARDTLAKAYDVPSNLVAASFIGPSWGADVTAQAVRGLIIFLVLVFIVMAIYFRTWKMSVSAILALIHDLVITAGFYGLFGLEVTPAAVIGLLTILGYSLYDTVVVFDKVRENRQEISGRADFEKTVNLAINQTLVRSINTSVVAILPVAAILFVGSYLLGAGTLRDISMALFVGMIAGTYSTLFIASPTYALLGRYGKLPGEKRRRVKKSRPASV